MELVAAVIQGYTALAHRHRHGPGRYWARRVGIGILGGRFLEGARRQPELIPHAAYVHVLRGGGPGRRCADDRGWSGHVSYMFCGVADPLTQVDSGRVTGPPTGLCHEHQRHPVSLQALIVRAVRLVRAVRFVWPPITDTPWTERQKLHRRRPGRRPKTRQACRWSCRPSARSQEMQAASGTGATEIIGLRREARPVGNHRGSQGAAPRSKATALSPAPKAEIEQEDRTAPRTALRQPGCRRSPSPVREQILRTRSRRQGAR